MNRTNRWRKRGCTPSAWLLELGQWSSPALELAILSLALTLLVLRPEDSDWTTPLAFLSLICRQQTVGLLSFHDCMGQFLIIHHLTYLPIGSVSLENLINTVLFLGACSHSSKAFLSQTCLVSSRLSSKTGHPEVLGLCASIPNCGIWGQILCLHPFSFSRGQLLSRTPNEVCIPLTLSSLRESPQ